MKDLNVRQESIKIQEENTGNTIYELGPIKFLQGTFTKAKEKKQKSTIGTSSRQEAFAHQRIQSTKLKDNLQNGRRYLQKTYQIKG